MSPDEQRRLAVVETKVETIAGDVKEIKSDISEIKELLSQARGGWRTLMLVGGIAGAVGAVAGKLLPFIPMKP